ncbi:MULTISPECIES: hypothetical protein [unclassified Clostridium]|uniref:hypothetical protein n=1 Tax=unclassified Clostridium TaxID=2614128 RepID=UPI000298553E|nr:MULTISPECIES: hypothetical protein [unclassified Clostridium]EKQ54701.1 MAG: hypothetical protein A370_03052 [Clostridium sp. Maddingley MBC34-26]
MTWAQEIFRALLLTFGTTEIITNTLYLIKDNGLDLARKQHGELPPQIPYKKIKLKVICMLSFGIIFFAVSLLSYLLHKYISNTIFISSILFCLYGIIEALYYRYWKTFGFAFATILLMIGSILI